MWRSENNLLESVPLHQIDPGNCAQIPRLGGISSAVRIWFILWPSSGTLLRRIVEPWGLTNLWSLPQLALGKCKHLAPFSPQGLW